MYNHELTDEYKALLSGVIDGSIPLVQREDEPDGHTEALANGCYVQNYPWDDNSINEKILSSDVSVRLKIDYNDFVWRNFYSGDKPIESKFCTTISIYGKPKHVKYRARVALEALKNRLDKGVL